MMLTAFAAAEIYMVICVFPEGHVRIVRGKGGKGIGRNTQIGYAGCHDIRSNGSEQQFQKRSIEQKNCGGKSTELTNEKVRSWLALRSAVFFPNADVFDDNSPAGHQCGGQEN